MSEHLSSTHFPCETPAETALLGSSLRDLLDRDLQTDLLATLAGYQRVLSDNSRRAEWPALHRKLMLLFQCGECVPVDGPMIGVSLSIRDSDYFRHAQERSALAKIEWQATAWNATFAATGLWMGKTFEPVDRQAAARLTEDNPDSVARFDPATTRIGRNFFREPANPNPLQAIGLPALTPLWRLQDRPSSVEPPIYDGQLLERNLEKEKSIPYAMTGGIFLADLGTSVVPEANGKEVYQLNYRWPKLDPSYPMTRLVDELVRIDDGVYLGQLVFASRHYSLGRLPLSGLPEHPGIQLGEAYRPHRRSGFWRRLLSRRDRGTPDYGYQNNGFFLMIDPALAKRAFADDVFPHLRPRPGEVGYRELGYDQPAAAATATGARERTWEESTDWADGWADADALREKFTTFLVEPSPRASDGDVRELMREGESILQMLQRISREISATTHHDDQLPHFEKLHRLFRAGVAPTIENGLFTGHGKPGYNFRLEGKETRDFYGEPEKSTGFDFYHGATLNLHCGFGDAIHPGGADDSGVLDFPSLLAEGLASRGARLPNALDVLWHSVGKYVFPWAGKSFEKISPKKLSMLLDESDDLAQRYPERVRELETHLASAPHFHLVKENARHRWHEPGHYAAHLAGGAWDQGMSEEDRDFWRRQASNRWVFGTNIEDRRILAVDAVLEALDMNYRAPDPALKAVSEQGPSPFVRHGYVFLGTDGRDSILPMNNGAEEKKEVFQFHYRYPMIGGPAPIGFCLDELVEIADGLFLGQLIYSTALDVPFHSSVDPAEYAYSLFGYFLLLDDAWEYHRQAIQLDTLD